MSGRHDESCGCGSLPHPAPPDIPAGSSVLSGRQWAGFLEYRAAMLSAIPGRLPLDGWSGRGERDLGVMLLEAWSIVLDTTGFYDARVAERAYLQTAPDDATARRLVGLIGYRPRPAMAGRVKLAVEADGADPLTLPVGTGFRSGPFDGEPPQVFELPTATEIWPQRNRWQLAPVRNGTFTGVLRFMPRQAPSAGAVVVVWTSTAAAAARIVSVDPEPAPDGTTYQRATLASPSDMSGLIGQSVEDIRVAILRLPLAESTLPAPTPRKIAVTATKSVVTLDSLYPQVRVGDRAVAEIGAVLRPVLITKIDREERELNSGTETPTKQALTIVALSPKLARQADDGFRLHVSPFGLGSPAVPAEVAIDLADIDASGRLEPPVTLGDAPAGGPVIVVGAQDRGAALTATVIDDGDGAAHLQPGTGNPPFGELTIPVTIRGNVIEVVRGETVIDEVLGAGDSSQPLNSYTLKKKPLTWVEDAGQADGRRPELTVRVDGVAWHRVDTFFDRTADERIYTVTLEPDGGSRITFGDGQRGARPASGVANIRADYRFGAGAAKPPPGSINQIAKQFKRLSSVSGPLPAVGGADAETAQELRSSAPARALTLGRAVSLDDFAALARSAAGVINTASAWAWDERRQRVVAKLWVIFDGGDGSADLAAGLSAQAAPDLVIAVEQASVAPATTLAVTLSFIDGHDPQAVRTACRLALFDARIGVLAPTVQRIGGVLFRSVLTHRLLNVPGVAAVDSIILGGASMPHAVAAGQGSWFDLEAETTVT